ncbi:MAG: hypothetical protein JW789_01970 [Candidatus Aenigmarchaeota archaeon]|nr:hypothetical protein [Candidatus Aenigmarchaeota archaeon]
MDGLAIDQNTAIALVSRRYTELESVNPNHELLRYIENVYDCGFDIRNETVNEFLERYEHGDNVSWETIFSRYSSELRNAVSPEDSIQPHQTRFLNTVEYVFKQA